MHWWRIRVVMQNWKLRTERPSSGLDTRLDWSMTLEAWLWSTKLINNPRSLIIQHPAGAFVEGNWSTIWNCQNWTASTLCLGMLFRISNTIFQVYVPHVEADLAKKVRANAKGMEWHIDPIKLSYKLRRTAIQPRGNYYSLEEFQWYDLLLMTLGRTRMIPRQMIWIRQGSTENWALYFLIPTSKSSNSPSLSSVNSCCAWK